MKNVVDRIVRWYRALPEKKRYVEFVTAVLSVPVMLTVIIINLNNLNQQKNATQKQTTNDKLTPIQIIITGDKANPSPSVNNPTSTQSPTPVSCVKEVGPVSILFPRENEVVTKDPVCITLATQSGYCSITWSYRLDNGDWSDYSDKNICFYNLANGTKTVQLKIRSSASNDEVVLQRTFIYQGNNTPTIKPTDSTSSATLQ